MDRTELEHSMRWSTPWRGGRGWEKNQFTIIVISVVDLLENRLPCGASGTTIIGTCTLVVSYVLLGAAEGVTMRNCLCQPNESQNYY